MLAYVYLKVYYVDTLLLIVYLCESRTCFPLNAYVHQLPTISTRHNYCTHLSIGYRVFRYNNKEDHTCYESSDIV